MFKKKIKKKKGIQIESIADNATEIELETEKIGKKRLRGVPLKDDSDLEDETQNPYQKVFVEETGKLQESDQATENKIDGFFEIPEELRIDNSRLQASARLVNTGLVEIPLTFKHTLDAIEPTEALKRRIVDSTAKVPESRFQSLHKGEYEEFKARQHMAKMEQKLQEKLEEQYYVKGKKLKKEREERKLKNQEIEKSWQS